jgi:hypothetical protein
MPTTQRQKIKVMSQLVNSRFTKVWWDISHPGKPRNIGGYSYTFPVNSGQVAHLPGLDGKLRAQCTICRMSKHTVMNNVCLDCQRKGRKHV